MRNILSGLGILLLSGCMEMCGQPTENKLFLPKDSEQAGSGKPGDYKNLFTVILGGNNEIFYYSGDFSKSPFVGKTDYKTIRGILAKKKKETGKGFVVVIKPGAEATYKNTVDLLDEMSINDIKRYALLDITTQEAKQLGLEEPASKPLLLRTGQAPEEKKFDENKNYLLIEMWKDGTVKYGFGKGRKQPLTTLIPADSTKFGAKIKELIRNQSGYEVLIIGDNDAQFPAFKTVIQALKENELYKFEMISRED